jgi:hypothetical protein
LNILSNMAMYDVAPVQPTTIECVDDADGVKRANAHIGRLCRRGDCYYVADRAWKVVVLDVADYRRLVDDAVRAGDGVARKRMDAAMNADTVRTASVARKRVDAATPDRLTREAVGCTLVAALDGGLKLAVDPVRRFVATLDDAWLARRQWTLDDVQRRAVVDAIVVTLVEFLGSRHSNTDGGPVGGPAGIPAGITADDLRSIGPWIVGWLSLWTNDQDFTQTAVVNGLSDHMVRGISVARLTGVTGATCTVALDPHPAAEELLDQVRETETLATLVVALPDHAEAIYRLKRPRDDDPKYYTYQPSKTRRTDVVAVHPGPLEALMSAAIHSAPSSFITDHKTDTTALLRTVSAGIRRAIGPKDLEALCFALATGDGTVDEQAALFMATALENTVVRMLRSKSDPPATPAHLNPFDRPVGILESTAAYMKLGSMQPVDQGSELSCALVEVLDRMVVYMELSDLRRRVVELEDGQLQIRDEGREGRGQLQDLREQLARMEEGQISGRDQMQALIDRTDRRFDLLEAENRRVGEENRRVGEENRRLNEDLREIRGMLVAFMNSATPQLSIVAASVNVPGENIQLELSDDPAAPDGDSGVVHVDALEPGSDGDRLHILGDLIEVDLNRTDWHMSSEELRELFHDHPDPRMRCERLRSTYFRKVLKLPEGRTSKRKGWKCIKPIRTPK